MSKIIKKQIKRSIPMVLILVLVSSLVTSFAFNFDVRLTELPKEFGSKIKLGFNLPTAKADTASTTVTVRNAPPVITGTPAENPTSASTTPVNAGASLGFTVTASDPESQNYYLIVCALNGVTAHNGGAPTCTSGLTYCTSTPTADDAQASCTYGNVSAAIGENPSWYAFVCDAHATEADCSSASSGSGESGSPFWVNHRPTINSASTTVNNINPGGTATLSATSTDTDVTGPNDELYVSFCSTNSWATSTGCAATTLCTATTTSTGVAVQASCNYVLASPLAHGSITYYAYVKDWHGMDGTGNPASANYTVNDVSPVMGTVFVNGGANITPNIKNAPNAPASSSVAVTDNNGCDDVASATSTLYWNAVSGGADCSANNNNCYQITSGNCVKTPGCSGAIANFVCSTTIEYLTNSTDNATSSPRTGDDWRARITARDGTYATSSISATGAELISVMAIDVTQTLIDYGTIRSSFNTGTYNATTTVVNFGNTPINSNVLGTNMTGPDTIVVTEQHFNPLANFDYANPVASGTPLMTTDQLAAINVNKPTSADLSSPIYWGINIPAGKPSGAYGGTNTFIAILYENAGAW